jgi:hypothetical protein
VWLHRWEVKFAWPTKDQKKMTFVTWIGDC